MRHRTLVRLAGTMAALSLVAAACGDDDGGSSGGGLAGMKGTTPLVDLSDDFRDRLLAIDPDLIDFNYAAESYDAAVIIALAAAVADADGSDLANEINGITRGGEKCATYADCLAVIEAGGDPDYDGVSGPMEFSGNGEPTVASYGILTFGEDNRIEDALTVYQVANAPAEADVAQQEVEVERAGDGQLRLGTLLPETGNANFVGPPMFAGVDLAIEDINAAGGVLGQEVVVSRGDSGDTSTDIANQTVDRLLSEDVDAIIGAFSSGVSSTVIDKITGAGVVHFSPGNTSKEFSTYPDRGLYFRNAPSDLLQGAVLGEVIAADGITTVGIMALDDPYGTGLLEDLTAALESSGIEVVEAIVYDPGAPSFDTQVQDIVAADPEGIVIIGFDESSRILAGLVEQGAGPQDKAIYGTDSNMGNALGENFDAGE